MPCLQEDRIDACSDLLMPSDENVSLAQQLAPSEMLAT